MGKRVIAWIICLGLVQSALCADVFALESARAGHSPKVVHLSRLLKTLGSGNDSLVAVRLRDNSVLSGYLAQIGTESFHLVDCSTGQGRDVPYLEVQRLQGLNLASGVEVHQGTGIRSKLVHLAAVLIPGGGVPAYGFSRSKTLIIGIVIGVILAIVLAKTL